MAFAPFPQLPDMGDEEIKRLAAELGRLEPADMETTLDAALLAEMQALSPEEAALIDRLFSGEDIRKLSPAALDQIAAKAPGLAIYLRDHRQFAQTGDIDVLTTIADDVVAATGYTPTPNFNQSNAIDGEDE